MPDDGSTLAATAPAGPTTVRSRAVRRMASIALLTLAAVAVAVALPSTWARLQLEDEDVFVATLAPLSADPDVQDLVIAQADRAIASSVDYVAIAGAGIDGLASLGLSPTSARALGLVATQPTADALRAATERAVAGVVRSERFSSVWSTTVRAAHRAVVFGATSDGAGIIVQTPEGLGVQIGGIVSAIAEELSTQGSPAAALIPSVDRVVIIGDGATLQAARSGYALATTAGAVSPLVALALVVGGVVAAPRRRGSLVDDGAVRGAGLAIAGGAAVALAAVAVVTSAAQRMAARRDLDPAGVEAVVRHLSAGLVDAAGVSLGLGVLVTVAGVLLALRDPRRSRAPLPMTSDRRDAPNP